MSTPAILVTVVSRVPKPGQPGIVVAMTRSDQVLWEKYNRTTYTQRDGTLLGTRSFWQFYTAPQRPSSTFEEDRNWATK